MIEIGGLSVKGERTKMTERIKTFKWREMIERGKVTRTDRKTERRQRTEINGMTGPREMKKIIEMNAREKKDQDLSGLWSSRGLLLDPSLRWTCGLLYRRAPQKKQRKVAWPQRMTEELRCPDTTHLLSSESAQVRPLTVLNYSS